MPRLSRIAALAAVCGLTPLYAHADVGGEEPFGAVNPLARAELAEVRGGFKIGAFDMNIGVTVQTGVNDRMALTSTFTIDGLDRIRQIGDTVANGLSSLNETLGSGAAAATATSSGEAKSATPAASSSASPTRGGAAPKTRTASTTRPGASTVSGQTSASAQPSAPPTSASAAGATANTRPASATPSAVANTTAPGAISIPGLTVSHAVNGLPRSVILNRLNNISISQRVQINLTIENFRDILGAFRAGRMASDAVRSALALRGS